MTDMLYPENSDDQDTITDGVLLAHLVNHTSVVDFRKVDLDTKICDLMASSRKSRSYYKKGS